MKKLTRKEQQIANARIKGKKLREIGAVQYPHASPKSQATLVSGQINKPHVAQYIEQGKLAALRESEITWKKVIKPVADALVATKQNQMTGEVTVDHSIRLTASKRAQELLESVEDQAVASTPVMLNGDYDEVRLNQVLFKKKT